MPTRRHKPPSPEFEHIHTLLHEVLNRLEIIMANETEIIATLKRAAAKQEKTIVEIGTLQGTVTSLVAEVASLKEIIAQGGTIGQELIDSANRVEALAGQADDQIPDVEPVPTP